MTLDEALEHPGPLLVAWDLVVSKGARTLTVFTLAEGGARSLVHHGVPVGREDALSAALRGRGLAIGEQDGHCEFVWLNETDGITVWGPHGRVLRASGDILALDGLRTLARRDLERVHACADADHVQRGVRARLRSGEEVWLLREVSAAAAAVPGYGRSELLYETEWARVICAAVAAWAGVPYEDRI